MINADIDPSSLSPEKADIKRQIDDVVKQLGIAAADLVAATSRYNELIIRRVELNFLFNEPAPLVSSE